MSVGHDGRGTQPRTHAQSNPTAAGTSASAPVFPSMVAMMSSERLRVGKSSGGLAIWSCTRMPMLSLADITEGQNAGGGADPAFRAAEGWAVPATPIM